MQEKPRVGLILMRSSEFRCLEPGDLLTAIRADEQSVLDRLGRHFEIAGAWVVDSPEALQICRNVLRDTNLDMVLLAYQTWAEDNVLADLLPAIGSRPLVVWCYLPWRRLPRPASFNELQRTSGLVGTFAALGTLRNQGAAFLFTFGAPDDPRLIQDLQVAGRAAHLRQALRKARFGVVPSTGDKFQCTFVDEHHLKDELGPEVQYLAVEIIRQSADAVSSAQVSEYLDILRERFPVEDVSEETLAKASRAALGLARMAGEYRLDLLAVNDNAVDLYNVFGMRPALYPDLKGVDRVLYQPESDLGAATANYILNHLTGSPTLFLEMYFWDEAKNQLVGGHGGVQNPAVADLREARVSLDYDCILPLGNSGERGKGGQSPGATLQFIARPGRVTVFQLRSTPAGWQAFALSGMCLEGQPWLEGFPHAILRLDTPVEHFLNRAAEVGVTQHWIMAYGSVLHEIEAFCQMEKIKLELLTY